ncbi:MAG: hypothetical protein HY903_13285 [Deltaproteobacteria bacterium]|nr:hypothetical protein [Deltaproteobacteria bacterium]
MTRQCWFGCGMLVLTMAGCATTAPWQKSYRAQRLALAGGQTEIVQVIKSYARDHHWTIVETKNPGDTVLDALSPMYQEAGMFMRRRWIFTVADGEVLVEQRLEALFDAENGVWTASTVVCDSYGYDHERREMLALATYAEGGRVARRSAGVAVSRR